MKRCPQCEFIYEDDQSLCDMDGVLLVLDSRTLPNPHALVTVSTAPKTQKRYRVVPVFATPVLALVFGMVYYVSTRQPSTVREPAPSALTAAPAPVMIPTPEPQPSAEPTPAAEEPKPVKEQVAPAPAKKSATKMTSVSQSKPTPEPKKKDDSKVNSILKKTGRILKKPFKF